MIHTNRRGNYLIGMVLATALMLIILRGIFEIQQNSNSITQQEYALKELANIGDCVKSYLDTNKLRLLEDESFQLPENKSSVAITANGNATLRSEISEFLPDNQSLDTLENIWGGKYTIVFIRTKDTSNDEISTSEEDELPDVISSYVLVGGKNTSEDWIENGVRKAAMNGGVKFAFVHDGLLKSSTWETSAGLSESNAQNGDLAYLVSFNEADTNLTTLLRYPTGNNEDLTMEADINMNKQNLLNVRYLDTQTLDVKSLRFDPTLYDDAHEAEASCNQNWFYIKSKELKSQTSLGLSQRLFVDSKGDVYGEWTQDASGIYKGVEGKRVGTFGINGATISERRQFNDTAVASINNAGRIYYIAPRETQADGTTGRFSNTETSVKNTQLAVCRNLSGSNSLSYIIDNRSEDKISFVVTAIDGDTIPAFSCPHEGIQVAGGITRDGETLLSTEVQPRLFVMPQIVSTGRKALPIQGIRAWAENLDSGGWRIRLQTLVDVQHGNINERTYWIGTSGSTKDASENTPGYMTTKSLEKFLTNETGDTSANYVRAVVIGVCSNKTSTF